VIKARNVWETGTAKRSVRVHAESPLGDTLEEILEQTKDLGKAKEI
jgi:hypothetical protein